MPSLLLIIFCSSDLLSLMQGVYSVPCNGYLLKLPLQWPLKSTGNSSTYSCLWQGAPQSARHCVSCVLHSLWWVLGLEEAVHRQTCSAGTTPCSISSPLFCGDMSKSTPLFLIRRHWCTFTHPCCPLSETFPALTSPSLQWENCKTVWEKQILTQ